MSLFNATVKQVAKDVSDETLKPVPNRNSADYCKILSLVERKTRSWYLPCIAEYKFFPTELTSNDILVEPVDVKNLQLTSSVLFENYTSTPSFHKAGEIGAKIAREFAVDVKINKTLQVALKLGDVIKQEILWPKLYKIVNGRTVKADHPLLKLVRRDTKKKLFVIGMVVTSGHSGVKSSLDEETQIDGIVGIDAGSPASPEITLHVNGHESSDSKQHVVYTVPHGTTLAYSCYRLKFENNGLLTLELADELTEDFSTSE